ncbi:MAG: selenide, water dikinase SelD [Halioglobus sp.]
MQIATEISRELVLVGGGHAHVLVLRQWGMAPLPGVRVTLISPATHTPYSGMLPGLVAGHYSFDEAHIDLARLCQWAGVRFIKGEVSAINSLEKTLTLMGRPQYQYDLLSVDTGSVPELDSVPGARRWSVPVKPVADFWQRWQGLHVTGSQTEAQRIVVVGGGAGSVELVMAMANALAGARVRFELFCGSEEILAGYNRGARRSVEQALAQLNIVLRVNARVVAVKERQLCLSDGSEYPFDDLFWCTGAAASEFLSRSNLQTDERGFLAIDDTLRSLSDDSVFAGGDVAAQVQHPRPKAGVYAVRQGPILALNLRNTLLGKPLVKHVPQRGFLSLLSLGGKSATANWGLFHATGQWVWAWKDRIDRKFMNRFEVLPSDMGSPDWNFVAASNTPAQMPCGGCGAKIGSSTLATVLAELGDEYPQHCPNGREADDTAIVSGYGSGDLLQSIDVLREMVSDPWLMGRIAANHALSDLYASGARPLSALATITLPFATSAIQGRELKHYLSGALHEFEKADCKLLGGHSLQGHELNLGFVVNGTPISKECGRVGKTGLRPGDTLILTKALGTGALFAGHMLLEANSADVDTAIDSMMHSNFAAAQLAVQYRVSAATDVTGFGLLGHLLEMLGSELGAAVYLSEIPLLPGALKMVEQGIFSSMHEANALAKTALKNVPQQVNSNALDLLFDPQTSGGLLLGVAEETAADLVADLKLAGYDQSAIVGSVTECETGGKGSINIL